MQKNKEVIGTILVFITAIISGFSIFANKIFVASIDPLVFTALRALFIGLIFLILSFAYSNWNPKKFKKVSWKYLIAIGIIGGGIAFWMFFSGLKLTTAGRSGFIHKTMPIYVLALALIFLKEKTSKKQMTKKSNKIPVQKKTNEDPSIITSESLLYKIGIHLYAASTKPESKATLLSYTTCCPAIAFVWRYS